MRYLNTTYLNTTKEGEAKLQLKRAERVLPNQEKKNIPKEHKASLTTQKYMRTTPPQFLRSSVVVVSTS